MLQFKFKHPVIALFGAGTLALASIFIVDTAKADQSGVSFWVPGFFGSLAAAPQQPGWSLANIYYHTTVSAGGDVALAREFQIGKIPVNLSASLNANVNATGDLGIVIPTYVFATPVLGGQFSLGAVMSYGRVEHLVIGNANGHTYNAGRLHPVLRGLTASATRRGVLGIYYRWLRCAGTTAFNNYMTYLTGDIPVGAYNSTRLSNIGIGHGAIDAGGGYTYFNPQTGREFSAVLGFTYNLAQSIDAISERRRHAPRLGHVAILYQSKFMAGLVGYVYKEIGCDSGSGDRVGCFQSQVVGIGPQIGFIFPVGNMQGYLNFKAYKEFAAENRPDGWNVWVTFVISPAAPTTSAQPTRMITK